MKSMSLKRLDALIFDFDGVLTNNRVLLDAKGNEWVSCHRGDGLAFDVFRKLNVKVFILSTEKNPVVSARAKKLEVPVLQGLENKVITLNYLAERENFDLSKILYVGNDLNDLNVMNLCGYSACPNDSHIKVKEIATYVLNANGGDGVVRELVEQVLGEDIHNILYSMEN